MITLQNDKLEFTFPEIASELRRLAVQEVDQLTTRFLAENRAAAFTTLMEENYSFQSVTEEYKRSASEVLLSLRPQAINEAIQKFVGRAGLFNPKAKPEAVTTVSFQRTLRIPDDGKTYPLPPSLGDFPLVHVDDYAKTVPTAWNKRGGVMMPMYQAEALWLFFRGKYPCALKVAAGKINAVTGKSWSSGLRQKPQDYLALPEQPWLDGYCVKKGLIRQFVAMPLGKGYTAEEQITGEGEHGGMQLQVFPLKASIYFEEAIKHEFPERLVDVLPALLPVPERVEMPRPQLRSRVVMCGPTLSLACSSFKEMGLGAGGMMRQEIYEDERSLEDYDQDLTSRCFVHLCNSPAWKAITGSTPPQPPISAQLYEEHGFPWFDIYRDDLDAVDGSETLGKIKTVSHLFQKKEGKPLPDNESVTASTVVQYGKKRRPDEVREWAENEDLSER